MSAHVLIVEAAPPHAKNSLRNLIETAIETARHERKEVGIDVAACHIDDVGQAIERHAPDVLMVDVAALDALDPKEVTAILAPYKERSNLSIVMGVGESARTTYIEMLPCADDYLRLPTEDGGSIPLVLDFLKFKLQALRMERARRRDAETLKHRVAIEKLVAEVSARFLSCPSDDMERCLSSELGQIAQSLGLKRTWVGTVADGVVAGLHEWCAEGFAPRMSSLVKRPLAEVSRLSFGMIAENEGAYRAADLPDALERQARESEGIGIVLGVPMVQEGALIGVLGGDSPQAERPWIADDLYALNNFATVLLGYFERQRTLSELKAVLKQQMQHEERLSLMGEMARSIVHDFRNVLTLISCSSDMMLMSPDILEDKERVRRDMLQIKKAVLDLDNMLRRLRQFYRPKGESEVFHPVDMNEVVQGVLGIVSYQIESQAGIRGVPIDVKSELPPDLPAVLGNDTELREVATNLLLNAMDAIVLANESRPTAERRAGLIIIRTWSENDSVILEVCDNGTGMTADVLQRCMEPNFSTKGTRGMGLGLALVAGVTQRHGGSVEIASEWGHGSTFRIHLPRTPVASAERSEAETTPRLNILLVDDDASVSELVYRFLTSKGHKVHLAAGGREALQVFKQRWFDLVVSDRQMPGDLSGEQLAAVVKEIAPDKPVIVFTGEDVAQKPGCVDLVMRKPFDLATFLKAIQDLIRPAAHYM